MFYIDLFENDQDARTLEYLHSLNYQKKELVCPNPRVADSLSVRHEKIEIKTWSNFIHQRAQTYLKIDSEKIYNKSKLFGFLAGVWKNIHGPLDFQNFYRCFNLYTDLKSYSQSYELLNEFLSFYDEKTLQAIVYFWETAKQLEIYDEHDIYYLLADSFLSFEKNLFNSEDQEKSGIIILGMNYMSSSQIQFLERYAQIKDIILPFNKEFYSSTSELHWPKWIQAEVRTIPSLRKRQKTKKVKFLSFNKDALNEILQPSFIPFSDKAFNILLLTLDEKIENYLDLSALNPEFKLNYNIFYNEGHELTELLENQMGLPISDIIENIKNFLKLKGIHNPKILSVGLELLKILNDWKELSDKNKTLNLFDFLVLREILSLNLPRNSFLSTRMSDKSSLKIYTLNNIDEVLSSQSPVLVISQEKYRLPQKGGGDYPEGLLSVLASLGPVKTGDFEFKLHHSKIMNLFENENEFILSYEEGSDEIRHFLNTLDLFSPESETEFIAQKNAPKEYQFKPDEIPLISQRPLGATAIGLYVSCPRKYYYHEILKFKSYFNLEDFMEGFEIGHLQHSFIDWFLKKNLVFDQECLGNLLNLVQNFFDEYLLKSKKNISPLTKVVILDELTMAAQNGLKYIFELKKQLKIEKFFLEEEVYCEDLNVLGRVDCFFVTKDQEWGVIDFKRSKGGIPSYSSFLKIEDIQLHFYIQRLYKKMKKLPLYMGYFSFLDPEDSLIISREKYENLPKSYLIDSHDLEKKIEEYASWEKEIIGQMNEDVKFSDSPQNEGVCRYCSMRMICPKGYYEGE